MKYYRIIGIVCVWIFFIGQVCAQSVPDNECLQLVALNDSDGVLKEMVIYPPIFCAMHDGICSIKRKEYAGFIFLI